MEENFDLPDGEIFPKKGNEDKLHYLLKNYTAGALMALGCTEIEDEFSIDSLRFDLRGKNPNGTTFAVEIGRFNCPSRLLKERLRNSYEQVDFVFWVPYKGGFERHFDEIRSTEFTFISCGHLLRGCQSMYEFRNGYTLYCFDLKLIFDERYRKSLILEDMKKEYDEKIKSFSKEIETLEKEIIVTAQQGI